MFNFKRQLKRYGKPFKAIVEASEGYYDTETGKWVPPGEPKEQDMVGIIAQMNDDDLKYGEGGTFTYEDKKILIDIEEYQLIHNQTVIINDKDYKVLQIADYSTYSNFMKVFVKRVSVND